jgi:Holliday junction resolvasome RuvABC endonuclease subunit
MRTAGIGLGIEIPNQRLTILCNDPSFTAWGYVVMRGNCILEMGCIKTKTEGKKRRIRKSDENAQRISEINKTLLHAIQLHKVNYILSEAVHGSQNASAAVMMGATMGILQTIADCLELPIEWYSEGDSKKNLLGKISATKHETIAAIDKLYDVDWTGIEYRDEAIADALSIHYVASKQSPTLKLMRRI